MIIINDDILYKIDREIQRDKDLKKTRNDYEMLLNREKYLSNELKKYVLLYDREKTRRLKAIEYIENSFDETGGVVRGSDLPYDCIQEILDILRGSE